MIRAQKSIVAERLFLFGLRLVMRHRFYGVFVRGGDWLASVRECPLIICANHSNWWDGFVAALLIPLFAGRQIYVAQYEGLLARYKPLRRLGAFGLGREGHAAPGVRYALRLLKDRRNGVWIFPQGVLVAQWLPITVKPGALWLARQSGAAVLPVAIRYEWMVESRPSIFINCGPVLDPSATDESLRASLQSLYDEIGTALAPVNLSEYRPLFPPRMSMNKRWESMNWRGPKGAFNPRNE